MYEPTEMAVLMRQMYEYNKVLRQQIINNDILSPLPKEFVNIHTAVMTDETERDSSYQVLAKEFLQLQQTIYDETDAKKQYLISQFLHVSHVIKQDVLGQFQK